ncbi:MAG: hypothetical protein E7522_03045 [Ruminococcaceae bacterium]|nr:hypothetical protein [Oscillospiraceae bacterium]
MLQDLIYQVETWEPFARFTFSGKGRPLTTITPMHYVNPHYVRGHFREGKYIQGYWRDGDGNTSIDRNTGYYRRNPGAVPRIVRNSLRGLF